MDKDNLKELQRDSACYWCGERAVETIEFEADSTGYRDNIDICHDRDCIERTRRVLEMRKKS